MINPLSTRWRSLADLYRDGAAALSLFTHHAWIGGFFIVGSGAHAALFLVADYRAWSLPGLERVLAHRHSVVVHLNWVSIFLGFHAFGMYIHNDTLLALGRQSDQFGDTGIPFRPVIGIRLTCRADLLVHHIHATGFFARGRLLGIGCECSRHHGVVGCIHSATLA